MAVAIENLRGRLRLRFRAEKFGKQIVISLGLPDNKTNRKAAEMVARKIELDILSGNFDSSLERYQPGRSATKPLTVRELFESFILYKKDYLYHRSLEKYNAVLSCILRSGIGSKSSQAVTDTDVAKFLKSVKGNPREKLGLLVACWRWKGLDNNPWIGAYKTSRPRSTAIAKPFTKQEVEAILRGFERQFPHYLNYIKFLFNSGCRTAEAVGLRWGNVSSDCSTVTISESLSKRIRKSTKTGRVREFPTNTALREMLSAMPRKGDDELVFTSLRGHSIDEDNFCNRHWKPVLKSVGVPYRKPYNCRHTFISHALASGVNPVQLANMTGHSVQILFKHYAGVINRPTAPDLYR